MIKEAAEAGGRERESIEEGPKDYEWMYERSFEDLDGHIWEMLYMDESAIKK